MKKKCIFIPLLLILLGAVAIGIAIATGALKQPEIGTVSNSWGDVTRDETEIITSIEVDNPNSFGARVGNVGLDVGVSLNDIKVGEGSVDDLDLPSGTSTVNLLTTIDNSTIPSWWASHIGNDEHTTARISPRVNVSLIGSFGVDIPPITREFDTDLLSNANSSGPTDYAMGPFTMTEQSRQLDWGTVSEESSEVEGVIVLRHDAPVPITVTGIDFTFVMNGINVAGATTNDPVVLQPNVDTPVPFSATIDNDRLLDWWPTHINASETTSYSIDVDVVLSAPIIGGTLPPIRVVSFDDTFQTNILGR